MSVPQMWVGKVMKVLSDRGKNVCTHIPFPVFLYLAEQSLAQMSDGRKNFTAYTMYLFLPPLLFRYSKGAPTESVSLFVFD